MMDTVGEFVLRSFASCSLKLGRLAHRYDLLHRKTLHLHGQPSMLEPIRRWRSKEQTLVDRSLVSLQWVALSKSTRRYCPNSTATLLDSVGLAFSETSNNTSILCIHEIALIAIKLLTAVPSRYFRH